MPNGVPFCTGFLEKSTAQCQLPSSSSPTQTAIGGTNWSNAYSFTAGTNNNALAFSVGEYFSGAIKTDGTLWLWGSNKNQTTCVGRGQLGNNSTVDQCSPVQTSSATNCWKNLSLGRLFSAATKTDGTLWVWGGNDSGQLGNNANTAVSNPIQTVSNVKTWCQVSLGAIHSAAIKTDGTLWLWGDGAYGKLGNCCTVDRSSPVQTIACGTNWKQVSLNGGTSAAIKTDGTLWLWGFNNCCTVITLSLDHRGILGNCCNINQSSPVQTVSTGTNWKQISLGGNCGWGSVGHSAAVKTDGTLWLWGVGRFGMLGNDATNSHSSPIQTIACGTNWAQVSAGIYHTGAVKGDGTLWIWGSNYCGILGINRSSGQSRSSPVQTISNVTSWKEVKLSNESFNSAAIKTDGTLWLWGRNIGGVLGNNRDESGLGGQCRSSPVQTVSNVATWTEKTSQPIAYISKAVASNKHAAAIKTDGTLWLWGCNATGQLGNSSTLTQSSPVQTITQGSNWKQISLSRTNSAAIKTDGTLWLWGQGTTGKLGNNDSTGISQSSPIQTVSTGTNWKQVSLGLNHSSAVKTDGTLWLWGCNPTGQLGNNSTLTQSSPVQTLTASNDWQQVSLGDSHSASIKTDGTLWLWGGNIAGQLGNNDTISQSSPAQTICAGSNWKQVCLGLGSTGAVKSDGTLWMWGCNLCGRLGDNTTTNQIKPTQTVSNDTTWKQVDLNGECLTGAVKTDGTLWMWGDNTCGGLGDNTTVSKSSPVQIASNITTWNSVSVGESNFAVAIDSSNRLYSWGNNSDAQLGCDPLTILTNYTDLGNQLVEKDYLIDAYPNLVPWMVSPSLWTWGTNSNGELGDNSTVRKSSPVQTISGGSQWNSLSKYSYVSAAIKNDGTLWLWGKNTLGQLGNNLSASASSPVQTVTQGTNWKQVSATEYGAASVKTDGTLWLWGNGANGRLGNNSTVPRSSPVQTVSNLTTWKQVSLGAKHSAAVRRDGTLWTWGDGTNGALGNNSVVTRSSPVQTSSGGTNWKQVSLGLSISAATKTDGTLWVWGNGYNLGTNSSISQSIPVQTVSTGTNWKSVCVGSLTTGAIKTDGTLWLWGGGGSGALGNNCEIDLSSPVQTILTGNTWKKVSIDGSNIVVSAIKNDGTLWLWGQGSNGKLGNNSTIGVSSPVQTIMGGQSWKDISGASAIYEVYDW